ncbi:MAG: hypothetical protein KME05_24280 [Gloeocapsa sp. UFS-A4-WI-NPMV-4B04]|nr:hypothetical protein [Gloeocapsa sp. UFS-A4-WI-NPMV-4B04]
MTNYEESVAKSPTSSFKLLLKTTAYCWHYLTKDTGIVYGALTESVGWGIIP